MGKPLGIWVAAPSGTVHWHERLVHKDGTEFWAGLSRCGMGRFEDHPGCRTYEEEPQGSCATCRRFRAKDMERDKDKERT